MPNVDYITIREIRRNAKKISGEVNNTNTSYIVMSNNRPQFVIVSLKNFSRMQKPQIDDKGASLMGLIDWAEKQDFDLPSDLGEKHDEYLWKKSAKKD